MQSGVKIEQHVHQIVDASMMIQSFLGWVMSLEKPQFVDVLILAGHKSTDYQNEKWDKFKEDRLVFVWNWTSTFVDAWKLSVK